MLNKNPFRINSKCYKFLENCNIDYKTGYSDVLDLKKLELLGLKTSNGGDWSRSDGGLGKYFNIDRKKEGNRIISVQLIGYNKSKTHKIINKDVRNFYKNAKCILLNIGGNFIELDHKDGRKDIDINDQNIDSFQPLHKGPNDAKRTHCNECKKSNLKFDARKLGYSTSQWIGSSEYKGSCVGCFWFDPYEFNLQVSKNFIKH